MSLLQWAGVFAVAAAAVTWAGVRLARAGDEIAERAGVSRLLVGMILMALALAAIVHGVETRVRRLEPDAVLLLAVYGGALYAVWAVGRA